MLSAYHIQAYRKYKYERKKKKNYKTVARAYHQPHTKFKFTSYKPVKYNTYRKEKIK